MVDLKDYYVGRVVKVEIRDKRLKGYRELGMALVNYDGCDQINLGEQHKIINGNIPPKDLNNFELVTSMPVITYLYDMERFDLFLERIKPSEGLRLLYINGLLESKGLNPEVLKAAFRIIESNCYEKGPHKKLHFVEK